MKQGYLISKEKNNNGHYSYRIDEEETVRLFHSRTGDWTEKVKGKQAVKLSNDGNGNYTAKFLGGLIFTLNICQLAELVLAANLHHELSNYDIFTKYEKKESTNG